MPRKKVTKEPGAEESGELDNVALEEIKEALSNLGAAIELGDYGAVMQGLLTLPDKLGQLSPVFAPLMGALVGRYGALARPYLDQLVPLLAEVMGYGYEKMAEIDEAVASRAERYDRTQAEAYARKVKVLRTAGFSQREAMEILLTGIARSKQSLQELQKSFSKLTPKRESN